MPWLIIMMFQCKKDKNTLSMAKQTRIEVCIQRLLHSWFTITQEPLGNSAAGMTRLQATVKFLCWVVHRMFNEHFSRLPGNWTYPIFSVWLNPLIYKPQTQSADGWFHTLLSDAFLFTKWRVCAAVLIHLVSGWLGDYENVSFTLFLICILSFVGKPNLSCNDNS